MKYFKLYRNPENKALTIPRAALQLSHLADAEELLLHTGSGYMLTARNGLDTSECLHLLDFLTSIASSLLIQLVLNSREEAPSPETAPAKSPGDEVPGLTIPRWLLEQAGLEAKECLEAFAEDGRVIVSGADDKRETAEEAAVHEEDPLKEFSVEFRAMLRMAGVDLENLCRQMRQEDMADE